jgi:hypothetical protein
MRVDSAWEWLRCDPAQVRGLRDTIGRLVRRMENDEPPAEHLPAPELPTQPTPASELPRELLWLLDAPMFIDEKQVDAFYDAVVRPDYEGTSLTLSDTVSKSTTFGGGVTIGAALPWFAKAEAEAKADHSRGRERGHERTLRPVANSYRHLLTLALHYASSDDLKDRVLLANTEKQTVRTGLRGNVEPSIWRDPTYVTALPRALVFLELAEARFIPTALELDNGDVVLLFDRFAAAITKPDTKTAGEYPGSRTGDDERDKYWSWFSAKFDDLKLGADRKALTTVETAVKGHQIAWIDYRVPLGADGAAPFVHLHMQARGEFATGVFAYNLISRGIKHGVRIVGTLKSEPDLNVLAIFER